jgi:hypothetical protein
VYERLTWRRARQVWENNNSALAASVGSCLNRLRFSRHFMRVGVRANRAGNAKVRVNFMTRKLSDVDRSAVDLVLDRIQSAGGEGNGNGGDGVVMVSQSVSDERLSAVERVLSALDSMPAPEPSADLAVRTLQNIARAANTAPGAMPQPAPPPGRSLIDPSAPLA